MSSLRFLTYLAPSIPRAFFELVVREVSSRLGVPGSLDFETSVSGPSASSDPFVSKRADFAFVCSPAFHELRRAGTAELVPAAPVFADPRTAGVPVYFADVVVSVAHPAQTFADLREGRWTYNDPASLSGWHSLKAKLRELGQAGDPQAFFSDVRLSGSHARSLELVASGRADASAIDSNALALRLAGDLSLAARLRVLESWGPLPIQPLLASAALDPAEKFRVAEALLALHEEEAVRRSLERSRVSRFVPVDAAFYDSFPILALAAGGNTGA
jgi:ABC-type phosphate/phosphonate transport system substrate-binding protein